MATPAPTTVSGVDPRPTPKAVSRERRRIARRRFWATYRKSVMGMAGLVILVVFVAMAVFAPVLVSSTGLDVTKVNGDVNADPNQDPNAAGRFSICGSMTSS